MHNLSPRKSRAFPHGGVEYYNQSCNCHHALILIRYHTSKMVLSNSFFTSSTFRALVGRQSYQILCEVHFFLLPAPLRRVDHR
jgi:hypothetical protein